MTDIISTLILAVGVFYAIRAGIVIAGMIHQQWHD